MTLKSRTQRLTDSLVKTVPLIPLNNLSFNGLLYLLFFSFNINGDVLKIETNYKKLKTNREVR
jgi:hypothetical protein